MMAAQVRIIHVSIRCARPLLLVLVVALALATSGGATTAGPGDVPPGVNLTKRAVAPVVSCDGCQSQSLRLVYLVLRSDDATLPTADPRVRLAAWQVTDTEALAALVAGSETIVSAASSVILPNVSSSYIPVHRVNLTACRDLLDAAGFPSSRSPRLALSLDVASGDPMTEVLAKEFQRQQAECGIGIDLRYHSGPEMNQILSTHAFTAALVSTSADAGLPFQLLHRLCGAGSTENYGRSIATPTEIDTLLANAAAATSPNARAIQYSDINSRVMGATPSFGSVVPILWEFGADHSNLQPPRITVDRLTKDELTLTVGATVRAASERGTIARTQVLWGDGTSEDVEFPISHTYGNEGAYSVTVVAYEASGVWSAATRLVTVAPKPLPPATSGTLSVTSSRMSDRNQAEVQVHYSLNGANDGAWTANVYYLQWCRDATGKTTGSNDGHGGLISYNAQMLTGTSGEVTLTFAASIVSNTPQVQFPVDCTHVIISLAHRPDGGVADILIQSLPLPAATRWESGAYVVNCSTCTGW